MSIDLFGERPRRKRRQMMHFTDIGTDMVNWKCGKCGYSPGWVPIEDNSVTAINRGEPCPVCNKKDS